MISCAAGVQLLVRSVAEQGDGATWMLFLAGSAIARRTMTLCEGRYRAVPIDSEACFLACCRTIGLNPVRARMVRHPRDDAWSSDHAHARCDGSASEREKEYRPHPRATATPLSREEHRKAMRLEGRPQGNDSQPSFETQRQEARLLRVCESISDLILRDAAPRGAAPRATTAKPLRGDEVAEPKGDTDFADARRAATNGGWARGDARFKRQIAKALDRQGSRSSRRSAAGLRRCRRADRRGGSRIDGS